MHQVFYDLIMRIANPLRLLLGVGPDVFSTKSEKETIENAKCFRNFVRSLILERREQLKNPNFKS
jgi:hypothetical protein